MADGMNAERAQEVSQEDVIANDNYGNVDNSKTKSNLIVIKDELIENVKRDLVRDFDKICTDAGISYFAFSRLLIGAVHYQRLIPGKADETLDVGLLREEYEKLLPVMREKAPAYGLIFDEHFEGRKYRQLIKRIGRNLIVDNEEVHVEKTQWLNISPFDKVPTPRDYQYGVYHRMNIMNDNYKIQAGVKGAFRLGGLLKSKLAVKVTSPRKAFEKVDKAAQKYNSVKEYTTYSRLMSSRSARITEEQLLPYERRAFYDFTIMTPHDVSPWTEIMDADLKFQIESIQKADLLILAEFDRVCKELGIGYFVCGGTMLGSVRHNGFIPWDDDIDCGLLRADYNTFLEKAGPLLSEKFFLQTRQSDPKIPYLFSKIRMNDTEYITEYNDGRNFHKGICLDLFPFDYIPNDPKAQEDFRDEVLAKSAAHNKISNMCIPEPKGEGFPRNFEDFWFRTERKLHRLFYHMKSLKHSQKKYIEVATRYNKDHEKLGLTTVASFVPSYTFIRIEDLLPYKNITFEGVPAKVPAKAEVFLKMQYGDFMSLPMKHQQVGHPLIRWSVDTKDKIYTHK